VRAEADTHLPQFDPFEAWSAAPCADH
jgi:hypothetical protein